MLDSHRSLRLSCPSAEPRPGGEYVRAYLQLHDGYVFASGHEITSESRVQSLVDESVRLYDLEGDAAFYMITMMDGTNHIAFEQDNTILAFAGLPQAVGFNLGDEL